MAEARTYIGSTLAPLLISSHEMVCGIRSSKNIERWYNNNMTKNCADYNLV
jgi:hypothetical protein